MLKYKATRKTYTTIVPSFVERIAFLVKRFSLIVTKIYAHYTFDQQSFKKDFIILNKVPGQNAKNDIENDFRKLLNNSNFGYGCRNNVVIILSKETIFNEIDELSYIQNYNHLFSCSSFD